MGQVGQLALGVVGAIVGGIYGGPTGAMLGFSLGSGVGMLLFPPKQRSQEGPRLADLQGVQNSSYGTPIPYYWGNIRVPGNIIWTHGLEEDRTEETMGGKGSAKGLKLIQYKYYASWASSFGVTEVFLRRDAAGAERVFGGQAVRRLWFDGKLVFDATANQVSANSENLTGVFSQAEGASHAIGTGDNLQIPGLQWRIHPTGDLGDFNWTDLAEVPDPLVQKWEGADAPLHKGLQYIVFERVPLEGVGNRIPTVSAEFTTPAFGDSDEPIRSNLPDTLQWIDHPFTPYNYGVPAIDPVRNVGYAAATYTKVDATTNPPTTTRFAGFSTFNATTMQELTAQNYGDIRPFWDGSTPINPFVARADAVYVLEVDQTASGSPGWISAFDGDTLDWLGAIQLSTTGSGSMLNGIVIPTSLDFLRAILIVGNPLGVGRGRCMLVDGRVAQGGVPSTSGVGILWDSGEGIDGAGNTVLERYLIPGQTWQIHVDAWLVERWMTSSFHVIPKIFVKRVEAGLSGTGSMGAAVTGSWEINTLALFQAGYAIMHPEASPPEYTGNFSIARVWHDPSDDTLVFACSQPYQTFIKWDWKTNTAVWDTVVVTEMRGTNGGGKPASESITATAMPFSGFGDLTGKYLRGFGPTVDLATGLVTQDPTIVQATVAVARTGVLYGPADSVFIPDPDNPDLVILREGSTINRHLMFLSYTKRISLAKIVDDTFRAAEMLGGLAPDFGTASLDAGPVRYTEAVADTLVRGYIASRPWTIQEVLQPVMNAFDMDATLIDGCIRFDMRGRDPVATIPYEDLILRDDGGAIEQRTSYSGDVARKVLVHHINPDHNYDTSVQDFEIPVRDTPIIGNAGETTVDLPISLLPEEAKAIALRLLQRIWNERGTFTVTLPPKYLGLVENDAVILTLRDGSTVRVRLTEVSVGADWTIAVTAVAEAAIQFASD